MQLTIFLGQLGLSCKCSRQVPLKFSLVEKGIALLPFAAQSLPWLVSSHRDSLSLAAGARKHRRNLVCS